MILLDISNTFILNVQKLNILYFFDKIVAYLFPWQTPFDNPKNIEFSMKYYYETKTILSQ